jgi:UrcA family protein
VSRTSANASARMHRLDRSDAWKASRRRAERGGRTARPMVMLYNAARADEPVATQRVSFKDLNLDSSKGAAVLYGRIKRAANEVCGHWNYFDLSQIHAEQTCVSGAVSRAVAQVNSPMLTSLYDEKTGKADKKVITLAQSR